MVNRLQEENKRLAASVQENKADEGEQSGKQSTISFLIGCCIVMLISFLNPYVEFAFMNLQSYAT